MNGEIEKGSFKEALSVHREIPEFEEGYLRENADRIQDNDSLVLIARSDGEKAGYCISYNRYSDSSFYIWMSGVKPGFRRKGMMTELLEETERQADEKGYEKLKIKTENRRKEMRQLLAGEGFDIVDLEEKGERSKNKFLMEKDIDED